VRVNYALYIWKKLNELKEKEGFEGSLRDYGQKFNQINQNLVLKIANSEQALPLYTPLFPVLQPFSLNSDQYEIAQEIKKHSPGERKTLRELQEQEIEIPALITSKDFLSEFASSFSYMPSND
jgi:hypothetical protein